MKFFVVKTQALGLKVYESGNQSFSFGAGIVEASPPGDATYQKFQSAFYKLFGNRGWQIKINFNRMEDGSSSAEAVVTWDVVVEAEILSAIQRVLYYGNDEEHLKIEVELTCYRYSNYYSNGALPQVQITDMVSQSGETTDPDTSNHKCYEKNGVLIPVVPEAPRGYQNQLEWKISVAIVGTGFVSIVDLLPPFSDTGSKIFAKRSFCDFEIISGDGTVIPCHKIFLCATSPVLETMLKGDLKEAKENTMTMTEMSTRGVTAFLKFSYCADVDDALRSSPVALELLKAADVYDIPLLWKIMTALFVEEPHSWFDVDVAVELYGFFGKCARQHDPTLKTKMLQVLAVKSEQLSTSTLYNQLFPSSVAKEMFAALLKANRP